MTPLQIIQLAFDRANSMSDVPCVCDSYGECGACRAAAAAWEQYYDLLTTAGLQDEDFRESQ